MDQATAMYHIFLACDKALLQDTFTSPGWGSAIIYFLSSQKVKTNNDTTSPKPRGSWTLAKTVEWDLLPQGLYAWIIKLYPLLGSLKDTWCCKDYLTFHLQKTVEFSHRLLCIHPAGVREIKSKVNTQESTVIILCNNVIFSENYMREQKRRFLGLKVKAASI